MKKKLSSKKCIAIVLAMVMIITSIPFMMMSALTYGEYDPAPYWGAPDDEYGAINTNFVATLNTDGSVDISFPDANAQKTYNNSGTKSIEKYVFTLTKLQENGEHIELYSEVFTAAQVATGVEGAKYPNHIYYGPGGLESLPGYDVQSTYDVAIMAIDSDGWFSDKIHTLLTDTPHYDITADFSPNEMWISRTLLDFEAAGTAKFYGGSQSTSGYGSSGPGYKGSMYSEVNSEQDEIDYLYNVNGLVDANGQFEGMGYDNSNAYRFWIKDQYSGTSFMFDSTWSRQHYNFTLQGVDNYENAEVWFYVDFSDVEIGKMAFHLRANEKEVTSWRTGKIAKAMSQYGVLFSTKAINGVNTGVKDGVYLQNKEGLWEETTMTDGYVTGLQGYEGFIRIPIEYFILQENQYITTDNIREKEWTQTGSGFLQSWTTPSDFSNYRNSHMFLTSAGDWSVSVDGVVCPSETVSMTFVNNKATDEKETLSVERFLINPAGTPVTESFIIYNRFERVNAKEGYWDTASQHNWQFGNTLAYDANTTDDTDASVFSTTAMTKNGTSYNIDSNAAAKAISDIASAGFEIADWSNDSVKKSFYLDHVLICQKVDESKQSQIVYDTDLTSTTYGRVADSSAVKFTGEDGFAGDYGYVVKSYYDRTVEVPKVVANYINQYVGEIPSLEDVNALEMINSIIETYINCFPGCDTAYDSEKYDAIDYIKDLGFTEAYNRYTAAVNFIESYINLGDSARNYNAVIAFESGVELLPDPEIANYNDETLKTKLGELMALYKSFNLSHFEILGAEAEDKFTELYSIIMGEEVKTGYSIGGSPFIPFNDFETVISGYNTNYKMGQKSLKYYDDYPTYQDARNQDVNNTKNFVTYATNSTVDMSADKETAIGTGGGGALGYAIESYNPSSSTRLVSTNFSKIDAEITNRGFANSLGATVYLQGDLNNTDTSSQYNLVTFATTYKGQNVNQWSELQGLNLSALSVNPDTTDGTDKQDTDRYGEGILPNSFVMYVDFTKVSGLAMNIQFILEDASGKDIICFLCAGAVTGDITENPKIYLLDANGEWEEQNLEPTPLDVSEAVGADGQTAVCSIYPSSLNNLEGYKGFIRIPLTNFRTMYTSGTKKYNHFLDNLIDDHTIKQVKVSFWDYSGKNNDTEVNIDAMGFTYDPGCQKRSVSNNPSAIIDKLNKDNGLNVDVEKYGIKNMDEYFRVKTNDSVNFEKMVAELDPYEGKEAFVKAYKEAHAAYKKLSAYQKRLEEVDHCYRNFIKEWSAEDPTEGKYAQLGANDGANYDALIAQEPWLAKYANATELSTAIGTLSVNATGFDIKDNDNALPYPYDETTGKIDYSALLGTTDLTNDGIVDVNDANAIIEMYEKGYMRLSGTEKSALSADDKTKLDNAYYAAQRILLVEDYMADIDEFSGKITGVYKAGTAEPDVRMVKYGDEGLLKALDLYDEMSVFAKDILEVTAGGAYNNMHAAAEAIYDNSHTITMSNGTSIEGGILIFERDMLTFATEVVEEKIETRTVLDTDTLNEIEYYLGQTESFLPRYAQVDEINVAYHKLADLLPTADIETTTTQALLTNGDGGTSYTTDVDLTYVAARLNRKVSVYVVSDHKWTQTTGSTYDFGYFTVNGATGTDGTTIYTKIGDYANGATAEINPVISVDETASKKVPNGAKYSGKIRVVAFDSALITDGVDLSTLTPVADVEIPVVFDSTNGSDPLVYEVQIPATVVVDWDDTSDIDVSYKVKATLGGNTLSVSVSDSGEEKGKLVDSTGTHTLAFTATNFKETTFTGDVAAGTTPPDKPSIKIEQTAWDNAPVGAYSTQLTYTVDVTS